jgi:nitroimidazol reductase NimA-like FMN-containing flavoprotein (pyridoxamine 5'-phosphate oxidase superfamily)
VAEILPDSQRAFLEANHSAVMATVDDRGRPHAVPVLCALVDGQPWLTVSGPVGPRRERRVEDNLRLDRAATGRDPDDLEEYRAAMAAERRLVDVLSPERVDPSHR